MSGRWPWISQASVSDARAVDDGDRAAPDDLHDVVGADDAGGVLVDPEPEQARVLGDQAEQPAEPVPLLEMLVDDDARAGRRDRRRSGPSGASGVAPDAPNAIMWLDIAEAPADVPATTAPCWKRSRMASASRVPPIVDDSRSWLPPVRKTPVASRTASAAASSLACGRVTAWSGRTRLTPSSPKTARYRSPASRPSDEAVLMTAIVASSPPARRDESVQDDAVADLVLRTADDDDGSIGHRRSTPWETAPERIADRHPAVRAPVRECAR